jgi:hypothetical protein
VNAPPSPATRALAVLSVVALAATGCVSHTHVVGLGATGTGVTSARQYYFFFGLLALNTIDTQRMAPDLTSYTIETSFSLTDFVLSPLLLPFSLTTRTVVVRT